MPINLMVLPIYSKKYNPKVNPMMAPADLEPCREETLISIDMKPMKMNRKAKLIIAGRKVLKG